jgi:salicylate hydroxylase
LIDSIFRKDASTFANLLNKLFRQGSKDIHKITSIYTAVRQPTGNGFVVGSRHLGACYELSSPGLEDIQEGDPISAERLSDLARSIERGWEMTWKYSAKDNLQRALDML